jgi:NDP-sugar pyrophosphorylase family protein
VLPKPLLPVGERPILEIIVGQLRDAGITEITLATGYLSGLIEAYFGDGSAFGVDISYSREDVPLGTAGPLAAIDGLDETFVLMNGDCFSDLDLRALLDAHASSSAVATIACHSEMVDVDFGVLQLSDDGAIKGIDEKPSYVVDVSMGLYVFEPKVLDLVTPNTYLDFPDLITALIERGDRVESYRHSGHWVDLGRVRHLEEAAQALEGSAQEVIAERDADPREVGL